MSKDIVSVAGREAPSTKVFYEEGGGGELMLTSYIAKSKSKGKTNVLVLSTMHKDVAVGKDSRKKPNTIVFYDKTKGGVDIVDHRIGKYTTKAKSPRWPLNTFAFVLDTSIVNASTIFQELFPNDKVSSREFMWDLAKQLILPHMQRRAAIPGIQGKTRSNIARFVPVRPQQDPAMQGTSECQRCSVCIARILGDDYKRKKNCLPKSSRKYEVGRKGVCKKHTLIVCTHCGFADERDTE